MHIVFATYMAIMLSYVVTQEEAEHLATAHPGRTMEVLVPFDGISLEWEELKHTLQGCEDSLMVASRLQSFIQVRRSSAPSNDGG